MKTDESLVEVARSHIRSRSAVLLRPAVNGNWSAADQYDFFLLVIVAIVLGLAGVVVKDLLCLLFIGIVVFLGTLLLGTLRMRRRPGKPQRGNPSLNSDAALARGSHVATSLPVIPESPGQTTEDVPSPEL